MLRRLFLILFTLIPTLLLCTLAFAANSGDDGDTWDDYEPTNSPSYKGGAVTYTTDLDVPDPLDIFNTFGNILNIVIGVAGLVFVLLLGYGAIKGSLAAGDPRALEGAKQTWTSALIGFGIIVGIFVIFNLALRMLGGSSIPTSSGLVQQMRDGLDAFLEGACIHGNCDQPKPTN